MNSLTNIRSTFPFSHPLPWCPELIRISTNQTFIRFLQRSRFSNDLTGDEHIPRLLVFIVASLHLQFEFCFFFCQTFCYLLQTFTTILLYLGNFCCSVCHGKRAGVQPGGRCVDIQLNHLMKTTGKILEWSQFTSKEINSQLLSCLILFYVHANATDVI